MNKRKRKLRRKRKRAIIIITSTFVLLFLAIFYTKGISHNNGDINNENTGQNIEGNNENNKVKASEIIDIKLIPEKYVAFTGEKIDLNTFKVLAISQEGQEIEISENIAFSTADDIISIQDNKFLVSERAISGDRGILKVSYSHIIKDVEIQIFNSLEDNIDEDFVITNPDSYDMLVNKTRNLSSDYIPEDLVPLDDLPRVLASPEINQLRKAAYEALKELFEKAKEEEAFTLYARSGYRSYGTQEALYNSYVANHGQAEADTFSAKAGQSEHQSGLAIDITCEGMNYQLDEAFFHTPEGKWVAENAHRFGFIVRYPKGKEDITGYQYEPWHLRYVGKNLANQIYESQLTMEEFFENGGI